MEKITTTFKKFNFEHAPSVEKQKEVYDAGKEFFYMSRKEQKSLTPWKYYISKKEIDVDKLFT